MSTTQTAARVITCTRPRCAAYQVMRHLDGAKLLLTCTRRGMIRMHELIVTGDVERPRRLAGDAARAALQRAIDAGYDVVAISIELEQRARASRTVRGGK